MTSDAERHFDRAKLPQEQQALDLAEVRGSAPVTGPWVTICGDPGPYVVQRPTPKHPLRLQVVTCTRPADHGGPFHQHADGDKVLCQWDRTGRPDWPPVSTRPRPETANESEE